MRVIAAIHASSAITGERRRRGRRPSCARDLPQRPELGFLPAEDHKPPFENLPEELEPAAWVRASGT